MVKVKIKKLSIHNFISFIDEEWDFENTSRLVLVKGINKDTESLLGVTSNGSGKSTWVNALTYSLFGQLSGKFHNNNLKNQFSDTVKDGFKMSLVVEVDTIYNKSETKHWKIVRGLQKTQSVVLQLFVLENDEWKDISKSTNANTQEFIENNVLMMNFEMYQRLVMLSVDDKYNFFKLNASQKRDFVETLFDTSVYSNMYKLLVDDLKTRNMMMQNLKVNKLKLEKNKELLEDEIEKYKSGVNDLIEETKRERENCQSKIDELEPMFSEVEERKKLVQESLDKMKINKKKLDALVTECKDKITSSRIDINNYQTTISHHERELNKHKEVLGMICDDCKDAVNKFYSLDVYRNEIDDLKKKISERENSIESSNEQLNKVKKYDDKLKEDETKKISELSDAQVQEKNLQFQKKTLVESLSSLEKKISDLVESIENKNKIPSWNMYQSTLKEIDDVEKGLKDEIDKICLLTVGSNIVSPDAIKKNIVSKVTSSINAMINSYLSELCVNFTCELSQDMNDYKIISSGKEVDLSLRSAGERMKLLISSQLAFRKFLMSRFNVGMNVMIIDEVVDRALDSVSIQALLGMLLRLSQKDSTNVSIISHREEVSEMVRGMPDTQLVVIQKENDTSTIVRN